MQVTMVEPGNLEQARAIAQQTAAVLKDGGLVVFPTETVYGIAASARSERGVKQLRDLKADGQPRPFTVHLPDPQDAGQYLDLSHPGLRRAVQKLLPGPVTLVTDVAEETIADRSEQLGLSEHRDRLYYERRVSLRCPDHWLAQELLWATEGPVIAGAANRPGAKPAQDAMEAADALEGRVDLVVDGGRCRYAKPSTVVRLEPEGAQVRLHVEREGVYDERFVRKMMRWTMLLVCSGNTCRSPMAEALARRMLAEERGIPESELESAGIRVISAGVSALPGAPASPEAVEALRSMGVDLARHRSRELTPDLIHEADVIFTMTQAHRQAVVAAAPWAAEKIWTLDPNGDVDDPIGSGAASYQQTAELIRSRLAERLKEQRS